MNLENILLKNLKNIIRIFLKILFDYTTQNYKKVNYFPLVCI